MPVPFIFVERPSESESGSDDRERRSGGSDGACLDSWWDGAGRRGSVAACAARAAGGVGDRADAACFAGRSEAEKSGGEQTGRAAGGCCRRGGRRSHLRVGNHDEEGRGKRGLP